jgi:hypothetical protein
VHQKCTSAGAGRNVPARRDTERCRRSRTDMGRGAGITTRVDESARDHGVDHHGRE